MKCKVLSKNLSVCKLKTLPERLPKDGFFGLTKTDEEISLVCQTENAPQNTVAREDGWRALYLEGTLDFSLIGILSRLTGVLAEKGIAVFAISTYNTDYLLVKEDRLEQAIDALVEAGYEVTR